MGSINFILYLSGVLSAVCMAILIMSPLLGEKFSSVQEKSSPYECGFDPVGMGHLGFSVRYFMIAMIFLIFDVEIALLLPLVVNFSSGLVVIWGLMMGSFLVVLILGAFYEWKEGALDWKEWPYNL